MEFFSLQSYAVFQLIVLWTFQLILLWRISTYSIMAFFNLYSYWVFNLYFYGIFQLIFLWNFLTYSLMESFNLQSLLWPDDGTYDLNPVAKNQKRIFKNEVYQRACLALKRYVNFNIKDIIITKIYGRWIELAQDSVQQRLFFYQIVTYLVRCTIGYRYSGSRLAQSRFLANTIEHAR